MKKYIIVLSSINVLLLVFTGIYFLIHTNNSTPRGQILLRVKSQDSSAKSEIIVVDGNGDNIRWVGRYEGSPTWSPDGRFIAVGCRDEICILDFSTLPDRRNQLGNQNRSPDSVYRIQAPPLCKSIVNYGGGKPYSGILSISWSPDGKEIAVVCGGEALESLRSVCIFTLGGDISCWDENISKNIYRVAWSPVDKNVIAIAGPGIASPEDDGTSTKIYLVDPQGKNPIYLTHGWSPEWSSTGEEIAFISYEPAHLGIAVINKDGTNRHWLHLSTPTHFYFNCTGLSGPCRLSWSPDRRYIIFVSSNATNVYAYKIHRVDIKTGNVIELIDDEIFKYVAEPDWGY